MKSFAKLAALGAALAAVPFASAAPLTVNSIAAGTYGASLGVSVGGIFPGGVVPGDANPFIAKYTETVYQGGTSALVFCPTCLNFVFSISNTATNPPSTDPIDSITVTNFGSFSLRLGDLTGSGTHSVDTASISVGGIFKVDQLHDPTMDINPGQSLDTFVIFTNASGYQPGTMTFQDGTNATGPALVAATPEPSSLMLLGTGLISAGGMLVRRRKITA